jgi:hypothetical protein
MVVLIYRLDVPPTPGDRGAIHTRVLYRLGSTVSNHRMVMGAPFSPLCHLLLLLLLLILLRGDSRYLFIWPTAVFAGLDGALAAASEAHAQQTSVCSSITARGSSLTGIDWLQIVHWFVSVQDLVGLLAMSCSPSFGEVCQCARDLVRASLQARLLYVDTTHA